MNDEEKKEAHEEYWLTLCRTVATHMVDAVLAEARLQGLDELQAAQGLVVCSNEMQLTVAEAIEQLSEGRR